MGRYANQALANGINNLMNSNNGKKKVAFVIVGFVAILALLIAGVIKLNGGSVSKRSGLRMGFVETSSSESWKCTYMLLDGSMEKKLSYKTQEIQVAVTTDSGSLSILIEDMNGNKLYKGNDMDTCSFTVGIDGPVKVKVVGEKHKGAFSITAK